MIIGLCNCMGFIGKYPKFKVGVVAELRIHNSSLLELLVVSRE